MTYTLFFMENLLSSEITNVTDIIQTCNSRSTFTVFKEVSSSACGKNSILDGKYQPP